MIISGNVFTNREKAMFALRALYSDHGFSMFRMSKFEEFDLYASNRDFMDAASIITFTDTDGMLMALKPDVTLSIVKNNRNIGNDIRKIYYNENVYRVSPKTHYFKEIMQVGLECLGAVDEPCISEVLLLAAESLTLLGERAMLDVSNLDILYQLIVSCGASSETSERIAKCIGAKNSHGLEQICREEGIDPAKTEMLKTLVGTYGAPARVLPELEAAFLGADSPFTEEEKAAFAESFGLLNTVVDAFAGTEFEEILNIDFSVISDMKYYNGIIFKGFIYGIPDSVLSGGQYDKLMINMKRNSKAIGFAVYMDALGSLAMYEEEEVEIRG